MRTYEKKEGNNEYRTMPKSIDNYSDRIAKALMNSAKKIGDLRIRINSFA